MLTVDFERKVSHFCFKIIGGPKANNLGKCFTLLVTVSSKKNSFSLSTFLNVGSSMPFYSGTLLYFSKYLPIIRFRWVKWQKIVFYEVKPNCILRILG